MAGDRPVLNVAGSRVAVRVLTGNQTINQANPDFVGAGPRGSVSTGAQAISTSPYATTFQASI